MPHYRISWHNSFKHLSQPSSAAIGHMSELLYINTTTGHIKGVNNSVSRFDNMAQKEQNKHFDFFNKPPKHRLRTRANLCNATIK